jgi:hypothetical protein
VAESPLALLRVEAAWLVTREDRGRLGVGAPGRGRREDGGAYDQGLGEHVDAGMASGVGGERTARAAARVEALSERQAGDGLAAEPGEEPCRFEEVGVPGAQAASWRADVSSVEHGRLGEEAPDVLLIVADGGRRALAHSHVLEKKTQPIRPP